MNEETCLRCQQLIDNRDLVKSVYRWDSGLMHLCCAGIYSARGRSVDPALLQISKDLLKSNISVFSNFRGTSESAIAAMITVSGQPEQTLQNALSVYVLLKKEFWSSSYLPLAAMVIAQHAAPAEYAAITARTRMLYKQMKAEHPFLTSSEDSAFCALLALSDKTADSLISDMEACYQLLQPQFFSSDAVQSLSQVLALCNGTPAEKCSKTMALFDLLKARGHKYGTSYELPTLGLLAVSCADEKNAVNEMIEIDDWLSVQKGFGFFGSITKKQRLMYAGMLAQKDGSSEFALQTATVGSTVALVIAQEAAMCAAVAASTAAAASHSHTS